MLFYETNFGEQLFICRIEPMKVICVHSAKGGVGKTTTALSIASILAEQEAKTIMLDLDPQAAATRHLAVDTSPEYDWDNTIHQVLLEERRLEDTLIHPWPNLAFCPSQLRLQNIERDLADETNPIFVIHDILDSIRQDFDFCIIDTAPNIGLLTKAALSASHQVIIPCLTEKWPIESLEISMETIEKISSAQKYLTTKIETIRILPTFFEERRQLTEAFYYALKQSYSKYLTETVIHRSVDIGKTYGQPLGRLEHSMRAKEEYMHLVDEILGGK
jgi:chromosome partitioning protein